MARRGHWIFGSTANRCASFAITADVASCSGVMSATKMPRLCVATTRSFSRGWMSRSCTIGYGGRPVPNGAHVFPPSSVANTPISDPTNSRSAFFLSCANAYTVPSGRPLPMAVQVSPKSSVLNTNGV